MRRGVLFIFYFLSEVGLVRTMSLSCDRQDFTAFFIQMDIYSWASRRCCVIQPLRHGDSADDQQEKFLDR